MLKEWMIKHRNLNKWKNWSLYVAHWGYSCHMSRIMLGWFCRRWKNYVTTPAYQELNILWYWIQGSSSSWAMVWVVRCTGPLVCLCYSRRNSSSWEGLSGDQSPVETPSFTWEPNSKRCGARAERWGRAASWLEAAINGAHEHLLGFL